jgi:hypothetical protein
VPNKADLQREIEWRRCAADFTYFSKNYWKIPVPRMGAQLFDFDRRPYQHEYAALLQDLEGNLIGLKARQIGLTTEAVAYAFWTAFFRADHPWLLVSAGEDPAKRALGRVKYGYARLPAWMKERGPQLVSSSTTMIAFDNDSKIESLPATAAAGRGDSVYGVIFDEAAHMQDPASVYGALEPLCYGPFIVFSTAKGMGNWFHKIWLDSELDDSEWTGVFYPWSAVPERDADWYRRTQLKYRGEEWLFYQEYPSTPEEAFAKSGQVAISDALLASQPWEAPSHRYGYVAHDRTWRELEPLEIDDVTLQVWEHPTVERDELGRVVRNPNYVIFCDTAEGLAHGDFNAVSVWNANTHEEVAAIETRFPIEYMGELLEALGYMYHTALIAVERNNTGLVPITYLSKDAGYPRLFRMPSYGKRKHAQRTERYGWLTNVQTKPKMVTDFQGALRNEEVVMHNERFREQMKTYVRDGKGSFNSVEGNHDDVIIATLGAWQALLDIGEYPTYFYDDQAHIPTWGDVLSAGVGNIEAGVNPLETPIGGGRAPRQGYKWSVHLGE